MSLLSDDWETMEEAILYNKMKNWSDEKPVEEDLTNLFKDVGEISCNVQFSIFGQSLGLILPPLVL